MFSLRPNDRYHRRSASHAGRVPYFGRLSRSSISVLINGESGTGKNWSLMPCIATVREPKRHLSAEYGGYPEGFDRIRTVWSREGAFTGANTIRQGRFEQADGARYFSTKLVICRWMCRRVCWRAGRRSVLSRWRLCAGESGLRIIAATHQNLEQRVQEGKFVRICSTA